MELFFGIFIGIVIIILVLFVRQIQIRKLHPPGPLGFPFLGILPIRFLEILFSAILPRISETKYFMGMKEKYGDIWSIEIGSQRIIVLASLEAMKEAFIENGKMFSGRPLHESYQIVSENLGILFVDGDLWHDNRQLALKALRDLGMGKRHLESEISNEVDSLIDHLGKTFLKQVNSPNTFVKAVSNIISRLAFNERNKYDDPEFQCYIKNLKELAHTEITQDTIDLFPKFFQTKFARFLFRSVDHYLNCNTEIIKFIAKKCRSRIQVESQYSKPNCIFDYFWRYRYEDNPTIESDKKFLSVAHTLLDIFNAGTDTTSNMLGFSCLILGKNKGFQAELQAELQLQTDSYKEVNMDMRKDCPKLLSFIDEIQRYCHLVPKVHHRVLETCMFRGYEFRPSDIILGDLATVFRDPNLFTNPNNFDPYRFMDTSRTKYVPQKSLIPFGIGKRSCLGESIAVMELFLFLSKLILKFDISLVYETEDNINQILDGHCGFLHAPLDHEIIFKLSDAQWK